MDDQRIAAANAAVLGPSPFPSRRAATMPRRTAASPALPLPSRNSTLASIAVAEGAVRVHRASCQRNRHFATPFPAAPASCWRFRA